MRQRRWAARLIWSHILCGYASNKYRISSCTLSLRQYWTVMDRRKPHASWWKFGRVNELVREERIRDSVETTSTYICPCTCLLMFRSPCLLMLLRFWIHVICTVCMKCVFEFKYVKTIRHTCFFGNINWGCGQECDVLHRKSINKYMIKASDSFAHCMLKHQCCATNINSSSRNQLQNPFDTI